MKFRLIYEGDLLSTQGQDSSNKVAQKHKIRKCFHLQIKNLIESDRVHNEVKDSQPANLNFSSDFKFVPMVWEKNSPHCSLDILFLRHDFPGSSHYAGDIDNRVKTLLDTLRMPRKAQELENQCLGKGETPFYCLFEDDSLVNHLSMEVDQLLCTPRDGGKVSSEVLLIVTVTIEPGLVTKNGSLIF